MLRRTFALGTLFGLGACAPFGPVGEPNYPALVQEAVPGANILAYGPIMTNGGPAPLIGRSLIVGVSPQRENLLILTDSSFAITRWEDGRYPSGSGSYDRIYNLRLVAGALGSSFIELDLPRSPDPAKGFTLTMLPLPQLWTFNVPPQRAGASGTERIWDLLLSKVRPHVAARASFETIGFATPATPD
jgi:hypothetical protein